jgi:hypothetical protein
MEKEGVMGNGLWYIDQQPYPSLLPLNAKGRKGQSSFRPGCLADRASYQAERASTGINRSKGKTIRDGMIF